MTVRLEEIVARAALSCPAITLRAHVVISLTRQGVRILGGRSCFLLSELAEVKQDLVQAVAGDVLHRVIADSVVLAVVEDADDVGVVQPRRRAGLFVEPLQVILRGRGTADA